jgi:hypothetical protein
MRPAECGADIAKNGPAAQRWNIPKIRHVERHERYLPKVLAPGFASCTAVAPTERHHARAHADDR